MAAAVQKKVVLLSGATGAIGKAIAAGIASRADFSLVCTVRSVEKGESLVSDLTKVNSNISTGFVMIFDCSDNWKR